MDLMQVFDMVLHVDKSLDTWLKLYGMYVYVVLFAIVFSETGLVVLFFLPGDSLLFIAGALTANGQMSFPLLLVLLVLAAVLGNTLNYYIGGSIGHRVMNHDYRWLNKDGLRRTHEFFEKHGGKTIILARFVPVVRTFAPFVAGISDMTHTRFQMFNITGAVLWVLSLLVAGRLVGSAAKDYLSIIGIIGICAAIVPLAIGALVKFVRSLRRR
jgi:membrane-associated protein